MSHVRQRGLAMVTVLLIMALVTVLVSGLLREHRLRVAGITEQIRANELLRTALAGERLALDYLRAQRSALRETVHRGQAWAEPRHLDLPGGQVRMRVEDLSARFNLTTLTVTYPDPLQVERWKRLCQALGIDPPEVEDLSGQRLLDPSQLRLIPGIDNATVERLRPWVAVLPREAGLNVNTAPTPLLAMLESVGTDNARRLIAERPDVGYPSVQRFLASPTVQGLDIQGRGLSVSSRWFRLTIDVETAERRIYLYSDLELDTRTPRVKVVRRVFSTREEPAANG